MVNYFFFRFNKCDHLNVFGGANNDDLTDHFEDLFHQCHQRAAAIETARLIVKFRLV